MKQNLTQIAYLWLLTNLRQNRREGMKGDITEAWAWFEKEDKIVTSVSLYADYALYYIMSKNDVEKVRKIMEAQGYTCRQIDIVEK